MSIVYSGTCAKCGHVNSQTRAALLVGDFADGYTADCTAKAKNADGQCYNEVYLTPDLEPEPA